MAYTDNFKRQHQELLDLVGEMTRKLKAQPVDAKDLRTQLSALAGKLSVHLAMEDKALYPRLLALPAADGRSLAKSFQDEMGGLGEVFAAFNQKWNLNAIAADPAGFGRESHGVFAALGKRISRENTQLYPLADGAL